MAMARLHPHARTTESMSLLQTRYGLGVSWDARGGRDVDIDLQCVVVDVNGAIIDCAYYNNLKAARAITHSGDETAGKPNHIEEMIWVNMNKLPTNVGMLLFVVAAYSGGSLGDINDGQLHIMEEHESREISLIPLDKTSASVNIVAAMLRAPSDGRGMSWRLQTLNEKVKQ